MGCAGYGRISSCMQIGCERESKVYRSLKDPNMTVGRFLGRVLNMVLVVSTVLALNASGTDVFIIGDSMMESIARALKKECAQRKLSVEALPSIGSGLARLDLLDWHRDVQALVTKYKPKIIFVMIGTNDNQSMRTEGGTLPFGSAGWNMEYGRRAGKLMDILADGSVEKVVWIGLPCMREEDLNASVKVISRVVEQQVVARPKVQFVSTYRRFSKKGEYSATIMQESGMPLDVRAADGIHLNRNGAELLAKLLIGKCTDE